MIIVTSQTFMLTMDDEDSYFPVLLHSIAYFAHLLAFTPHKSFIFLSLCQRSIHYTLLPIHYPLKKRRIYSRIDSFSCSSPGIIIMFHRETSHTHTRHIFCLGEYQSYILTSSTTIAFQPFEIQRVDVCKFISKLYVRNFKLKKIILNKLIWIFHV